MCFGIQLSEENVINRSYAKHSRTGANTLATLLSRVQTADIEGRGIITPKRYTTQRKEQRTRQYTVDLVQAPYDFTSQ